MSEDRAPAATADRSEKSEKSSEKSSQSSQDDAPLVISPPSPDGLDLVKISQERLTEMMQRKLAGQQGRGATGRSVIVNDFRVFVKNEPNMSLAVATVRAMTEQIKFSLETTATGLVNELNTLRDTLIESETRNKIAIETGAKLFMQFFYHLSNEVRELRKVKKMLIECGENFYNKSLEARETIGHFGAEFIRDRQTILTHGYSRAIMAVFKKVASKKTQIRVIVTEGMPDMEGKKTAYELAELGMAVDLIPDTAVGYVIRKVSCIIIGAEAVAENGGIINKLGTYQISLIAKAYRIPVYVAVESYKFTRIYPLTQDDIPEGNSQPSEYIPTFDMDNIHAVYPRVDFTPPQYITSLFTNLGVLTPSAVSDELIKLFV